METDKILEHLSNDDLPPDLKLIAENVGLKEVIVWLKHWDGYRIVFPKLNYMDSLMEKYIRHLNNHNVPHKLIAREIDRSVDYVKTIIKKIESEEMKD